MSREKTYRYAVLALVLLGAALVVGSIIGDHLKEDALQSMREKAVAGPGKDAVLYLEALQARAELSTWLGVAGLSALGAAAITECLRRQGKQQNA